MTRLPGCAKWHPDSDSIISETFTTNARGERVRRRICKVCDGVRRGAYVLKRMQERTACIERKPYGVIPLNWPAPEL